MKKTEERRTTRRGRGRGVLVTGYSRTKRVNEPERQPGSRLPSPVPESALYRSLAAHLSSCGYTCWRDVSYLGSWIDLLARRDDGHTIAVELKVTAWKRAWQQALRVRGAANQTYIGVWAPYVHRALVTEHRELFEATGVGVYSVNGACEIKVSSAERTPPHADHIVLPARPSHRPR